ncbi:formyl transferase [Melampsora americana]|nr:formyl transferase [Melampsora americana]
MFRSTLTFRNSTQLSQTISLRSLHASPLPLTAHRRFKSTLPHLIFFGSDSFSCVVLKEIIARRELWDELHVVTPPIARKGRGLKNVYRGAQGYRICLEFKPSSELGCTITENSDHTNRILITASFPYFIPKSLINQFPTSHCLNLHPSQLPLYRGPAPIQWQLAHQINPSGVTIQDLSPDGFDLGDILVQQSVPLPPNTSYALAESFLGRLGGNLMCQVLQNLPDLIKTSKKQNSKNATKSRKILQTDLSIGSGWDLLKVKSRYLAMGHQVRKM